MGGTPRVHGVRSGGFAGGRAGAGEKKGKLAFPTLRRISPKTLQALLEKVDVELPPFASLDLIAERNGGLNDDFILPYRLPAGRKP